MAKDTERRFHSIMNKLLEPHKSNAEKTSCQKHPYSSLNFNGDKGRGNSNAAEAPPRRPWDRKDLMRRLATFKSMTWFAKPKAVDAVNCARRGWINVDLDIILCEVCNARLQFSTPSAWNHQQVEKAALVFSLKLDTGHKLLCPWIDASCDESLGLFPPTPAPVLVDMYKERSSALLQLSALPSISVSAVESMNNPLLKHFLEQLITVELGTGPNDSSWTKIHNAGMEVVSGDKYHQAHRLLSLCGWEPRLLSYIVDCGDQPKLSCGDNNVSDLSLGSSGEQNNKLSVYVSGSGKSIKDNENLTAVNEYYDPSSTVLDCKLCGASVGLWAFVTVPRPLEMVRVVGFSEIGDGGDKRNGSTAINDHLRVGSNDTSPSKELATLSRKALSNLTIAGGPPPAKQNFRAMISLPVIGRNLRARFSHLSAEVTDAREEGHASQTTTTDTVSDKLHNEESTGPKDNACTSVTNGVQSDPPQTVVDDVGIYQHMNMDNVASTKNVSVTGGEQRDDGVREVTETSLPKNFLTAGIHTDPVSHSAARKMEFDPIRQHRHFCPWVVSTETTAPGWQQTLSALYKEKLFLVPDNEASPSSPSFIKVDDPITSIRKLFESPPAKKLKPTLT